MLIFRKILRMHLMDDPFKRLDGVKDEKCKYMGLLKSPVFKGIFTKNCYI